MKNVEKRKVVCERQRTTTLVNQETWIIENDGRRYQGELHP